MTTHSTFSADILHLDLEAETERLTAWIRETVSKNYGAEAPSSEYPEALTAQSWPFCVHALWAVNVFRFSSHPRLILHRTVSVSGKWSRRH